MQGFISALEFFRIGHSACKNQTASLETIVNIANVLDVTVDRLLCGNLDSGDYTPELRELFSDCNNYEKNMIFDMANELKKSLRKNKELMFRKRNT